LTLDDALSGDPERRDAVLAQVLYAALGAQARKACETGGPRGMPTTDLERVGEWLSETITNAGMLTLMLEGKAGATVREDGELLFSAAPEGERWIAGV